MVLMTFVSRRFTFNCANMLLFWLQFVHAVTHSVIDTSQDKSQVLDQSLDQ